MRTARRRRGFAGCACGWMLFGLNAASGSEGTASPATFTLKIDRQPLDAALQQLARQAGLQVIFFSRVTEGVTAPAINGEFTLAAGMQELLAGSSLTFRVINEQTVEVRPARTRVADYPRGRDRVEREAARGSTNVSGEEPGASALQEVVVVGLAEQLVATRIATRLREIPQTVSIVSREQIRLQNSTDLADVLNRAPGLTMSRHNSLTTEFYARGYLVDSLHVDGGAGLNTRLNSSEVFMATPDLSEFDHVEILRGSDALFSGGANPGGTVSLARKRPQNNFAIELYTLADSHDGNRVEVDVTGPLSDDGSLRGRADAIYDREGYFYEVASRERKKIFGVLEYDLANESTLTAGLSYQWEDATPVVGGLPFYRDGTDSRLPRDLALGLDWSWNRTRTGEAYLQYRHQFSTEWGLKVNAAGWRTEVEYAYGEFPGQINPATNRLDSSPQAFTTARPNFHNQRTADATLMGTLDWFGRHEELAIGIDWTRIDATADGDLYSDFAAPLGDVASFDPAGYPFNALPDLGVSGRTIQEQTGVFASLRVYFDAAWSVVTGARINNATSSTSGLIRVGPLTQAASSRSESDPAVMPFAAVMYSMNEHYSLYASYADIYDHQGDEQLASGRRIDPVSGVNIEAGIKGEWRGGAVNGSVVVYGVEKKNLPNRVSRSGGGIGSNNQCCYEEVSSKSRGVDLELSGELMPGWRLGAGYTFNENETPEKTTLSTMTPKHLLKAWTNLRLPGELRRWEIGGTLHAQSATESRQRVCLSICPTIDFVQDAYSVLDLRAGFDIDSNWRVSLSVANVFDRIYYESFDSTPLHGWYGAPRNATLRFDGTF